MIRIVVDGMGGDSAPDVVVEGVAMASLQSDLQIVLVGPGSRMQKLLRKFPHNAAHIDIVEAADYVRMDEKPQEALAAHPNASILVAAKLVGSHQADALVSAGNTGACILAAARNIPRIPGIRRAALAAVYPTERRHGPQGDPFALMLDVGATLEASADDLVRFALMGSAYAQVISRNPRPHVALLSNGEEATKGRPEIVEAHQLLKGFPAVNFMGNVEGIDIPRGTADVIICNGFVGNIVLKMLEGVSEVVGDLAHYAMERSIIWKAGMFLLSRGIRRVLEMTDFESYGGAPMLGLEKVVIKAHGRSGPRAIRNAIKVAAKAVRGNVCEEIAKGVQVLERQTPPASPPEMPTASVPDSRQT